MDENGGEVANIVACQGSGVSIENHPPGEQIRRTNTLAPKVVFPFRGYVSPLKDTSYVWGKYSKNYQLLDTLFSKRNATFLKFLKKSVYQWIWGYDPDPGPQEKSTEKSCISFGKECILLIYHLFKIWQMMVYKLNYRSECPEVANFCCFFFCLIHS